MMFSAVVGPWIIRLVYPIFLLFLCCCIYECCFQDILIFICFVTYSLVILINAYSVSQGWLWRSLLDMSHPSLLVNAFIGICRQKPSPVLRRNDLPQAGAAKLFLLPTAFVTRGSCTPGQERMGSWKGLFQILHFAIWAQNCYQDTAEICKLRWGSPAQHWKVNLTYSKSL